MPTTPDIAFVLAAGLGTRMQPLTNKIPKPMVELCGRPLLDYVFDHLRDAGVKKAIVNLHHKPDVLRTYLEKDHGIEIIQSYEDVLLETGGGAKKVLPLLGDKPFYMINGDAFWTNGPSGSILKILAQVFDEAQMDILLDLIDIDNMLLTEGIGDYSFVGNRRIERSKSRSGTHMFTGLRICHPRVFADAPDGPFSFLKLMDRAEAEGRLYGIHHDGDWHHISTPDDLRRVEASMGIIS